MKLIEWNDLLTGATGRSGTRYGLTQAGAAETEAGEGWIVTADDEKICVAQSATDAASRIEHLEALRCFAKGLARELTAAQLAQARAVAAEMAAAAETSLAGGELTPAEASEVDFSRRHLLSLQTMIGVEQERRDSIPLDPRRTLH